MEYLCLLAEIESLKSELASTKRPKCPHTTSKGSTCKKYCLVGFGSCKVHSKPPKPVKLKRKRVFSLNQTFKRYY